MPKNNTLLIVDDNALNRKILCKTLNADGYKTIEAENGQAALDLLISGNFNVSLILLDIVMPVMDGNEFLKKFNEIGMNTSIPVIVTTGNDTIGMEIRCLESGASDYLIKPYNPDLVRHRVKSILRLCENAAIINKLEFDQLTNMYIKECFFDHVKTVLSENSDKKYVLICSNIENFKIVNEKYGSDIGDSLLRYIAHKHIEFSGGKEFCGRLSGDKFAILCEQGIAPYSQDDVANGILNEFKDSPVKNFSIKYGLYYIDDITVPVSVMCDRAQLAISTIKHRYGVYFSKYNDSMRTTMVREHQIIDLMEQALSENQFSVFLQPKHNVKTTEIAGAEALVRWKHPDLGFISPGEFIPVFEKNGFIFKLDKYVLEEVCKILKKWIENNHTAIPISVNVSRIDFDVPNFSNLIQELADSYQIPHELLHFEVTESAYTDNPQQIISVVSALRSMQFKVEMDDFGSGYSSLNMLSELPIDILKLDMRFSQSKDGTLTKNKKSILSFILSLSKWLGLPTVAEGVETEDEVEILKSMGCDYIQGYYFSKPMNLNDFEKYMSDHKLKTAGRAQIVHPLKTSHVLKDNLTEKEKVLIVEDIENNCELLKYLLEPYYTVVITRNGKEAYQYLKDNSSEISVILLDLLMPVMDGFELLELLKKGGYIKNIPIIITSELGTDSDLRAIRLGADSFIEKPYNSEIVIHRVKLAADRHKYLMQKNNDFKEIL